MPISEPAELKNDGAVIQGHVWRRQSGGGVGDGGGGGGGGGNGSDGGGGLPYPAAKPVAPAFHDAFSTCVLPWRRGSDTRDAVDPSRRSKAIRQSKAPFLQNRR